MGFDEAVRSGFRKWNKTGGRALRSEYWWWYLFGLLSILGSAIVGEVVGLRNGAGGALVVIAVMILFVPSFTVGIRRLHDTNRSGWWLLLNFLPYVGSFVLFAFSCLNGSPGPNRFGERPGGNLPTYRPEAPMIKEASLIGVADELRKLDELRTAGTISTAEFDRQRARLLGD